MTNLVWCVIASALLCAGCVKRTVIPDPSIPHQLAEPVTVTGWCRTAEAKLVKCKMRFEAGDWIASKHIVETATWE